MAKVTELLTQAIEEVKILEDAIHGQSPLEAKLRDQEAQIQTVAKSLAAKLTDVENRTAAVTEREAAVAARETAVETQKQVLKDLQTELLAKTKK